MVDSVTYEEVGDSPFPRDFGDLPTMETHATTYNVGAWSGVSAEVAQQQYMNLYNVGLFMPTNFGISLTPYDPDSAIAQADLNLYNSYELGTLLIPDFNVVQGINPETIPIPFFDPDFVLPFLCSSIPDIPLIEANTESYAVGNLQMNHVVGHNSEEILVNLIETRNGAIGNSIKAIKNIMFDDDGTQALPNDYAMILNIYAYDRHSKSLNIFNFNFLVALKLSNLTLDVETKEAGAIIPVTFIKLNQNILSSELNTR